jgi:transposase
MDKASAHTTAKLQVGENIQFIFLPAYAPEINPIERFCKELKDWLADYAPKPLAEARTLVSKGLQAFSEKAINS